MSDHTLTDVPLEPATVSPGTPNGTPPASPSVTAASSSSSSSASSSSLPVAASSSSSSSDASSVVMSSVKAIPIKEPIRRPSVTPKVKRQYEAKLMQHRESTYQQLERFMDKKEWKRVEIKKKGGESLGVFIVPTSSHAVVPGAIVSEITPGKPAHLTGQVRIGDQLVGINGASVIGMKFEAIVELINGVTKGVEVVLELVDGRGAVYATKRQGPNPEGKTLQASVDLYGDSNFMHTYTVRKKPGDPLGFTVTGTFPDTPIPSIFLTAVNKNGPSWKVGLKIGDQILKINGQSVVGLPFNDIISLIGAVGKGGEVRVEVVRVKTVTTHTYTIAPNNSNSQSHGNSNSNSDNTDNNSLGIRLSVGKVFYVEEESEVYKAGIRAGMYVMTVNDECTYATPDESTIQKMSEPGTKTVCCLSFIPHTGPPNFDPPPSAEEPSPHSSTHSPPPSLSASPVLVAVNMNSHNNGDSNNNSVNDNDYGDNSHPLSPRSNQGDAVVIEDDGGGGGEEEIEER